MKTLLFLLMLVSGAHGQTPTYEIGYSSFAVVGINCSTGTAIQLNKVRPPGFAFNIAGYRVQNQSAADAGYFGGVGVSSFSATNRGEKIISGASADWNIGKDYASNSVLVPLYCIAADAAGAAGAALSVVWFGY